MNTLFDNRKFDKSEKNFRKQLLRGFSSSQDQQRPYGFGTTSQFRKDVLKIYGKPLKELYDVVNKLRYGEPLDKKYKNHTLKGTPQNKLVQELHLESDLLFTYAIKDKELMLLGIRVDDHIKGHYRKDF